jgi:P-type conjugative transfer ATPase TrbB
MMSLQLAAKVSQDRRVTQLGDALSDPLPILDYLAQPDVEDVYANADGKVWVGRRNTSPVLIGVMNFWDIDNVIRSAAGMTGHSVNHKNPILEITLPDQYGSCRMHGMVPPITDAPVFTLRTRPRLVFSIQDYVADKTVTETQADEIRGAVAEYRNILSCGATGSGKTTFSNTLLRVIADLTPNDRVITIEDTFELQCSQPDHVALHAAKGITIRECLRSAMRMIPKRIVVGEVRGREALDMTKVWNTGHPGGLTTVHANSAHHALVRIESLIGEARVTGKHDEIAETFNLIAYFERDYSSQSGRRLKQLARCCGATGPKKYQLENIT